MVMRVVINTRAIPVNKCPNHDPYISTIQIHLQECFLFNLYFDSSGLVVGFNWAQESRPEEPVSLPRPQMLCSRKRLYVLERNDCSSLEGCSVLG